MSKALMHQANQSLEAAKVGANASRDVAQAQLAGAKYSADATLKGMEQQANAAIKSSQNAAIGGIIGSALGAHTTHEEIKQWLPHEVGAATIQSHDMAMKWQKTLQMRTMGYSDAAIEYELQGKSHKALFADSQWNALKMMEMTKKDVLSSVQQFGIQSPGNPYGLAVSEDDWMQLHSFKDPRSLLEVDPQVAAQRQKEFAQWEQSMRSKGMGLVVDIYKNPQLGGSGLLTMKGKDGLLDPALGPLLKGVMGDQAAGGEGGSGGTNWNQAIGALTKGEVNPMTGQIKKLMEQGVVDKYGMINAGELMKHVPPSLQEAPEFKLFREMGQDEVLKIKDQYNQFATMKVDPKLIREENMGFGVSKKVKLNADGTIAATAMHGTMIDAMGNSHMVAMSGNRLQEWYDRQSMIGGKGPLFPGMAAPVTQDQISGRMETGFWGKNVAAAPNRGSAGSNGSFSYANLQANTPAMPSPLKPAPANIQGATPAANKAPSTPAGFSGAPLKAGE
jgi:hypothetical protein